MAPRTNGTTEEKHFVSAGGMVFAQYTRRSGNLNGLPTTTISYFHQDHLGSISAITNQDGAVTERMAYDPWGKRRNITTAPGTADTQDALYGKQTDRGFTMHEHLDEMGIIHMNGRVYDPLIGRFMSADPFIQSPMDLQSYNRYAYVRNNPLTMSDPTGHFWWWVVAAIVAPEAGRAVGLWDERTTRILQGIGLGIITGGATMNWIIPASFGSPGLGLIIVGGAAGGFVSGAVIWGTLDGAVNGALSGALGGALFGAAGMVGEGFSQYAAHAAAGCVSSAAGGGSCGQGAVSALFGKYTTNQIGSSTVISGDFAKGVATAVAGGVGSMIAGGKFENGAVTAGYGYLFNYCSHGNCTSKLEQTLYDWMPGYKAGTLLYNQTMGDGSWTGWEVVDAVSVGAGVAGKGLSAGLNGGANSVFWSGHGAMNEAAALGTTLEKTPVGSVLNVLQQNGIGSRWVWGQASATFANNASGTAQVVIRYNNPASIFYRTELPILQRNGVLIQPR